MYSANSPTAGDIQWTDRFSDEIISLPMKNALIPSLLFIVFQFGALTAHAAPISPPNCNSTAFSRNAELLHQIAIIGDENRLTIEQYARKHKMTIKQAKKKFAATGFIHCRTGTGTTQLTGKNNVITTAGHTFFLNNCDQISDQDCYLEFPYSNRPKKMYKIKPGSLVTGNCTRKSRNAHDDWAVAELQEAVPNVKPYKVPGRDFVIEEGTNIVQVAASTNNFKINDKYPFNINTCTVRDKNHTVRIPIKTDCDSGGWASGAGQFIEDKNGNLTLAAIHIGSADKNDGRPGLDYNPNYHYNVSRGVEGEFLEAIYEKLNQK